MRDVTGKDVPEQSKMERRVRGNPPARCGSGEKAEVISSEPYLSTCASYAAGRLGIQYLDILAFYYTGTVVVDQYGAGQQIGREMIMNMKTNMG